MKKNKIELYGMIGFWIGVCFITLINTILNIINKDPSAYQKYLLGVSIIILIAFAFFLIKGKAKK
jgi:ribose/xylose/arabinose/galactoside ABC-type transport system permease subunit